MATARWARGSEAERENGFALSKTLFVVRHKVVNGQLKPTNGVRVHRDRSRRTKRSGSHQRDMTASSFLLTLMLIATVAATSADQPAFWLLLGPAPLAAVVGAVALVRSRLAQKMSLRGQSRVVITEW
jgi:hypothetical protein